MLLATAELRGGAVVVRDDAAEFCFPMDLALVRRSKINIKNVVADLLALMRPREIIMRKPFSIDVVKVINTQADKVVKALRFYGGNITFRVSVRLGGARRRFYDVCTRTLPESIEARCEFGITITDQVACFDTNIIQPHGGIPRLLKYPFLIGMKCGRQIQTSKTRER